MKISEIGAEALFCMVKMFASWTHNVHQDSTVKILKNIFFRTIASNEKQFG